MSEGYFHGDNVTKYDNKPSKFVLKTQKQAQRKLEYKGWWVNCKYGGKQKSGDNLNPAYNQLLTWEWLNYFASAAQRYFSV